MVMVIASLERVFRVFEGGLEVLSFCRVRRRGPSGEGEEVLVFFCGQADGDLGRQQGYAFHEHGEVVGLLGGEDALGAFFFASHGEHSDEDSGFELRAFESDCRRGASLVDGRDDEFRETSEFDGGFGIKEEWGCFGCDWVRNGYAAVERSI
jgi:hypothetical protein